MPSSRIEHLQPAAVQGSLEFNGQQLKCTCHCGIFTRACGWACTGGHIRGDIWVEGHPKVQETFARISGYVEQFDIHSPALTVRESFKHSAQMRLMDVTPEQSEEFVDEVLPPSNFPLTHSRKLPALSRLCRNPPATSWQTISLLDIQFGVWCSPRWFVGSESDGADIPSWRIRWSTWRQWA